MTSAFVEEIQTLLDDLRRKERSLELITKFIETGGAHRLSISVDHPDPEVKAAIETIARAQYSIRSSHQGLHQVCAG